MKKNFAKKLATVLSLTMVASLVVPAMPASAATAPDLAKRRTYVYEGNEYSYAAINAKGYTVKWSVSGEGAEFVDLSATKGTKTVLTVATEGNVAAKLAPVAVKAKFYKDGELKKTRTDNVNIKVSATGVAITETATVAAGETTDFNRTLTPANATSKTYWSVTDKDGKAVDAAVATIDAAGVFKATKAGDYKVVASVRNAKDSAEVAHDSQDIKAELKLTGVKLTAVNKVALTFNDSVKDVIKTASDVKIETVATNKSMVPVKEISVSEDGKTVTATTYGDFANDVTYKVTAVNSLEFKAQVGSIDKIVIESQTLAPVALADAKVLSYKVLDQYGVDVTAKYPIGGLLTLTSSSTTGSYVDVNTGKVVMAANGDVVTVQLKYLKWNATTGADESILSNVATITCNNKLAASTSKWTIDTAADWTKVKTSVAAEDNSKSLFVVLKDNYGSDVTTGFKFTSLDTSVLLVDTLTGKLYPLKAGSAVVKVECGTYVDYITVPVTAKIASTKLVAETTSYKLSNSAAIADSKNYKFTLTDNYDAACTGFAGTVNLKVLSTTNKDAITVSGSAVVLDTNATVPVTFTAGVANVTFQAVAGKTGSASFLLTADGKSAVVTVEVVAPTGASTYKVELSDTDVDKFVGETSTVSLYSVDASQVKIAKLSTVSGTSITYTVKDAAGNTKIDAATYHGDGTDVINPSTWAVGTYTVTVNVGPVSTSTTFTVKSTKKAAVAVVDDNTVVGSDLEAALQLALTTKVDGTAQDVAIDSADIINLKSAVAIASNGTIGYTVAETSVPVYVKTVTFTYNSVVYTADVNAIITISQN